MGVVAGCVVVAIAAVVIALVVIVEDSKVDVGPASAFYAAPDPLPQGPPGTILRSEVVAVPQVIGAPAGTRATRILYLSQASHDSKPVAVSAVIYQPPGLASPSGRPVLAWAHGTQGVASNCAPSLVSAPSKITVPGFGAFLKRGWVVAATDYPGLGTAGPNAYLDGTISGRAVLDSVRAAQILPGTGAGSKTVIWGHSQGGQAALFAGSLAASYAPNLDLLGVAVAAPAVELSKLLQLDANDLSGLALASYVLWSWPRTQPGISTEGVIKPGSEKLIDAIAARCLRGLGSLVEEFALAGVEKVTDTISVAALTASPAWTAVLRANTPAADSSGPPLLIAQGTADTIIRPETTYDYVLRLCDAGRSVKELRMEGIDHPNAGTAAAPAVLEWATQRLAGAPTPSDCIRTMGAAK